VPEDYAFEVAVASHVGTERRENQDNHGQVLDSATTGMVVVADGVSGAVAGETASQRAVETTLRTYRALQTMRAARRLQRAVQQANIDVYDLAVVVPELRGMATTLTAMVIDRGTLVAAHVGDCRLYLLRRGRIRQLTKDHTVVGDRVRLGLMSEARAQHHPDRSVLTRSVGRELIVAIDRISAPLLQDDRLILCSDGLYNVLDDLDLEEIARGQPAELACRALIDTANARGTPDNLTAAVVHLTGAIPEPRSPVGLRARLRRLLGRDS
jgi:serine/threonine protein phosphatase PrpC